MNTQFPLSHLLTEDAKTIPFVKNAFGMAENCPEKARVTYDYSVLNSYGTEEILRENVGYAKKGNLLSKVTVDCGNVENEN